MAVFFFFFGLAREQTVQTAPMSHLCAPNGTVVKKKNTQDERHGYQIIIKQQQNLGIYLKMLVLNIFFKVANYAKS